MGEDEKKNKIKNGIIGAVFLIWFFGSMIAMLVCSKLDNRTGILLALFGQYFLVFGILGVGANRKNKPFPLPILLFPLVGVLLLACGISIWVGGEQALVWLQKNAPYILIWIFPLVGAGMIVSATCNSRHLKRVCTREVQAKCIDVESTWSPDRNGRGGRYVYMPVYSIFYNGEEKILRNYIYTNMNRFEQGEYYYIKINPDNPEEFIDSNNKKAKGMSLILGVVFLVISVPVLVYMYMNDL